VTCHDTSERLSDLLDEALDASPRALVEAHLSECADCRRELERLRATVSLLQRVEPLRAPAGFVDRVMQRAYPVPWYRRLGAWLFLPLSAKLPVEAAAMILIAMLAVYLWEHSPELRGAARMESPAPPPPSQAPASPSPAQAPPQPPAPAAPKETPAREAPPVSAPASAPPAVASSAPLQTPGTGAAPPPAAAESESKRLDKNEEAQRRPSAKALQSGAMRQQAPPGVLGRLDVKDRAAADGSLADLIAKVGGRETGRSQDAAGTVVEILVPETRYAEFIRGLEALGTLSTEGHPTTLPLDPPQIRIAVRIQ